MTGSSVKKNETVRKLKASLFLAFCLGSVFIGLGALIVLLVDVFIRGFNSLDISFLTSFPSRFPERAGIKSAIYGSVWLMVLTAFFSIPIGIGAAIYLEEYSKRNALTSLIKTNISNLAGVPSIVYGILGLALFVRALSFERSLLSGSLTMALLVMPIIVVAAREAIKSVPRSFREASLALGATRWQTTRRVVIPSSIAGMITGIILALSRAIGETAPLIMIGALTFVAFVPDGPMSAFTVLPIQIFNWVSRPQAGFHDKAAAAIIVLLAFVFTLNIIATIIRNLFEKPKY